MSQYFVTDKSRMECVIENPYFIVTNNSIQSFSELLRPLETITSKKETKNIVIIAKDIEQSVLNTIISNKIQ
jgi:chaperonin GroEL